MEADMLCCGYTLLYTMGMERRMTKKEEVVSCVQRLAAAAPEKREVGVTTQELAEQLQMQRSNPVSYTHLTLPTIA